MSETRVLFVADRGIDRSEQALLGALRRAGVNLHLLMGEGCPRAAALIAEGMPFTALRFRSRFDPAAIRAIRAELRGGDYALVHCVGGHKQLANAAFAARGLAVKLVGYRGTSGRLHRWAPTSWLSYLNPRVDMIVCCAESVRRFLLRLGIAEEKLVTIYKGHDPDWYDSPPADLASLGIPDTATVLACAARIRPVKGVDLLLEAFFSLKDADQVHLLLIGEVADERVARRLAAHRSDSRLHVLGQRDDVLAWIAASDIFVMPSRDREGIPRAVVEAMSHGVAPIVSDAGGLPELVEDGVSGRVVARGEVAPLAEAIQALVDDPATRATFSAAARERMRTHLHIDETVRRTLALYDALTKGTSISAL